MSSAGNLFQLSESTDDHADKVDSSTDDNAIAPLLEESDIKKEEEKEKMGSQSGRIDVPVNDAVYLVAGTPEHRLFKKRWLLLVSMCMLSLSNGMVRKLLTLALFVNSRSLCLSIFPFRLLLCMPMRNLVAE